MSEFDLLAIGVNPALDTYYRASNLEIDAVNRVDHVRSAPGGKAINFARAFQRIGGRPIVTGILGGRTGAEIRTGLLETGLTGDFVESCAETRRTVTVVGDTGCTVLLERGVQIEATAFGDLITRVSSLAASVSTIAIMGSLPPSAEQGYLAELIGAIRSTSDARIVVDTTGEPLRQSVDAGVDLIKINADEFEAAFDIPATDVGRIGCIFECLQRSGLSTLIVTAGARGALVLNSDDRFAVRAPVEQVISTVGTGDAFLAGLLIGLKQGKSLQESSRLAAAAGAAATQVIGAGFIDPGIVQGFVPASICLPAEALFAESLI